MVANAHGGFNFRVSKHRCAWHHRGNSLPGRGRTDGCRRHWCNALAVRSALDFVSRFPHGRKQHAGSHPRRRRSGFLRLGVVGVGRHGSAADCGAPSDAVRTTPLPLPVSSFSRGTSRLQSLLRLRLVLAEQTLPGVMRKFCGLLTYPSSLAYRELPSGGHVRGVVGNFSSKEASSLVVNPCRA